MGRYELVHHLAAGGMASVYLARVSGLGGFERHVVLKTLASDKVDDDAYVSMFLDEARLVATLHHQHIAQVFEVGRADDGRYFLAMEYVHGETVRAVLERANERNYRLPLEFGLTIACAAAAGLHHAHERCTPSGQPLHIVHRDVSPSNVIVSYDGSVKLIDFGIAKAELRSTQTRSGLIKGKSGYMAPEQALGYAVDRRSDVFTLGILAYELTTQKRAFRARTQFEVLQKIVHCEVEAPSRVAADYPAVLEDVVMTALERYPDDRFQDADEMRRALEAYATGQGLVLGSPAVARVLGDLFGPRPEPWLTAAPRRAPRVQDDSSPFIELSRPLSTEVGDHDTTKRRPTEPREALGLDDDELDDDDEILTERYPTSDPDPDSAPVSASVVISATASTFDHESSRAPTLALGSVRTARGTSRVTVPPPVPGRELGPSRSPTLALGSVRAAHIGSSSAPVPAPALGALVPVPASDLGASRLAAPASVPAPASDLGSARVPAPALGRSTDRSRAAAPILPGHSRGSAALPLPPTPVSEPAIPMPLPRRPAPGWSRYGSSLPVLSRRRFPRPAILFGIAILVGVVGGLAWALSRDEATTKPTPAAQRTHVATSPESHKKSPESKTSRPPAASASVTTSAPAASTTTREPTRSATAEDMVTLRVTTDPVGATVVLDGVRLGVAPYTTTVPKKAGGAWLKVRKRHHIAQKIRVDLERDVTWDVQLSRTKSRR